MLRRKTSQPETNLSEREIKAFVENVVLAWAAKFPERAELFKRLMKQQIEVLANPSGMSKDGNLMYRGSIPQEIFFVIENKIPNFFNSPQMLRYVQEMLCPELLKKQRNFHFIDRRPKA